MKSNKTSLNLEAKKRKLQLCRETMRRLTNLELELAAGAATVICTEFCQSKSLCHC